MSVLFVILLDTDGNNVCGFAVIAGSVLLSSFSFGHFDVVRVDGPNFVAFLAGKSKMGVGFHSVQLI